MARIIRVTNDTWYYLASNDTKSSRPLNCKGLRSESCRSLKSPSCSLPANVDGMGVVPTVEEGPNSSETGVSVAALVPGGYACVAWLVTWLSVPVVNSEEAWVPVEVASLSLDVYCVALGASVVSRVSPGGQNLRLYKPEKRLRS